ncbi:hypothetical protein [Paractinoplanes maris]|uniref:hypothetical protein n=1 Tax=Paractinoplanes maris TaxID=1734446 RepID=UPI00201FD7D4|nr:hypothetical protein [Actinoplanes maris]
MPADVKPYLVPLPETVVWEPWHIETEEEGWTVLPDEIDGWDPGTDLRLARRVRVDANRLRHETGVEPADVVVAFSWTSSSTGMTEAGSPVPLGADGIAVLDARLVGERVSGTLTLRSALCLARRPTTLQPGVASIAGSVLCEQMQRVALESQSSMFPMQQIDFAATRLSPAASWHLESSTELLAPFFGAFRVLINTQDRELCAALMRGAKDRRQQALLDELEAGVAALLLEIALSVREDLIEREDWPPDTVGDVLDRTLEISGLELIPPSTGQDIAGLRTRLSGAVRQAGRGRTFR